MSFVTVKAVELKAAAGTLQSAGAATVASNSTAAVAHAAVVPPAADPVSAALAEFFCGHAQDYHVHAARGSEIHQKLVASLLTSSLAYDSTEIANDTAL